MKKKALLLVLAAALIVVASIGGTLAWLTKTDTVTNTFTVGQIGMSLDEGKVGSDGKLLTGDDAELVKENNYHIVPGAVLEKNPTVTVSAPSEGCYVFMKVIVPEEIAGIATLNYDTANWDVLDATNYPGVYYYKGSLVDNAVTSSTPLPSLFTTVTISADATADDLAEIQDGEEIVVQAYAVQRDNVELGSFDNLYLAAWDLVKSL